MKRKVGRPRGSGPAQLIRAVLVAEVYLAVKELEERGRPLSELLADQLDADPLGTLTKLKPYLPVKGWSDWRITVGQVHTDMTDVARAREAKATQFYAHVSRGVSRGRKPIEEPYHNAFQSLAALVNMKSLTVMRPRRDFSENAEIQLAQNQGKSHKLTGVEEIYYNVNNCVE